jgi:hypothetical protein
MNRPQSIMLKITTPTVGLRRTRVDDAAAGALAIHLARRGAGGQECAVQMDRCFHSTNSNWSSGPTV